ncbi:hypothetical protein DL95DRAFT_104211 [Leptodontidium sp. 2 PMI_412]|nr:hypothetical protein DL95DRAFT_104211 [Leptodontidium sp. 2 PMI_412]
MVLQPSPAWSQEYTPESYLYRVDCSNSVLPEDVSEPLIPRKSILSSSDSGWSSAGLIIGGAILAILDRRKPYITSN